MKVKSISRIIVLLVVLAVVPGILSCGGGGGPKITKIPVGYTGYTDEVNYFKLAHPSGWKLTAFKRQGGCNISMPVNGALFVKTKKAWDGQTLSKTVKSFRLRLKIWGDKLVMHKEAGTTLSGKSAQLFVYTMKSKYGDKTQYIIFALAGGRYYELIFDGKPDAYEKVKDKIQTVVDTFHITK